ncbi:MAG: PD40 domain-containing protein [Armatimonadetes bacterium]|nr:PD40 domain-containing protein [Armatimonadota bacterium]
MRQWGRAALVAGALLVCGQVRAELPDGFNHPEVQWYEFDTPHFTIVYNAGLTGTARLAAEIAEQVHPGVCEALGVTPGERTTAVLADYDDVGANNFAQRMQHVIYLYNPVMNQARIDRRAWLTSLLTHEYTHVINGWALRRAGGLAGTLTEWSGMEYQPQWFTEGLAEYVAHQCRTEPVSYALYASQQHELLEGAKLDIADARFNVIETATVYKQGHAMCVYLAERFGPDVFHRIISRYGTVPQWDLAFSSATGLSTADFVGQAVRKINTDAAQLPTADPVEQSGNLLATPQLQAALAARPSPDGKWFAVYGVGDWEEPIPGLWIYSADGQRCVQVASKLDLYASWKLSWSPDSSKLMYVARSRNQRGSVVNVLAVYDLGTRHSTRIAPAGWRVGEGEFSPDGKSVVFGTYRNERAMVAVMGVDGSNPRVITQSVSGDCFSPTWSPDSQQVAFSVTDAEGTDLAVVGVDGSGYRRVTHDAAPDQYPAWSPDGKTLAFVSYRQGVQATGSGRSAAVAGEAEGLSGAGTNIYTVPVQGGDVTQVTAATTGGVFYPAWTPDGKRLMVSLFKVRRAQVRSVPASLRVALAPEPPPVALPVTVSPTNTARGTAAVLGPVPALAGTQPATRQPVQVMGPAGPAKPGAEPHVVPYRGLERVGHYLTRPYNHDDGLGTAWGVRSQFGDPLGRHRFRAELEYGAKSHEMGYSMQYRNDQSDLQLAANIYKRVPPYRLERGLLVADRVSGVEVLAELPVTWAASAYVKDKLQLGFEAAEHTPFATAGGVLFPPPARSWIVGPSLGFTRTQLLPGVGQQELKAKIGTSDRTFGASLGFFHGDLSYVGRYYLPNPRGTVNVAGLVSYMTGSDYTRRHAEQTIGLAEVRYEYRLCDQLFPKLAWPAVHIGPVYLDAGYQMRDVISGSSVGIDARDQVNVQLRNSGFLTRMFTYDLSAGNRTYLGGGNPSDWYLQAKVHFRTLPY